MTTTQVKKPHTPTLGWTIGIVVFLFIGYHFLAHGKKR